MERISSQESKVFLPSHFVYYTEMRMFVENYDYGSYKM